MRADGIVPAIRARLAAALARPQGDYAPLRVGGRTIGWLDPARAARLRAFPGIFDDARPALVLAAHLADCPARTATLERVALELAAAGLLSAWRDERYAVAAEFGAAPLVELERAAARYFGIRTYAVHINGLVRRDEGLAMWLARRSPGKAIDPGMLDNLVGGGIAAGLGIVDTLCKEAWEEAGIPAAVAASARARGSLDVCRPQPQGLQRETVFVYDLVVDADFVPANQDGEAVEHRLVSLPAAAQLIAADTRDDQVTADASLVILDCLLRYAAIEPGTPDYRALTELLRAPLEPTARSDGFGAW
ncbi:MAG: DUF4743 domain-containing protein [Casimicrobiaceae bacterium]